jgi:hypothetical protein
MSKPWSLSTSLVTFHRTPSFLTLWGTEEVTYEEFGSEAEKQKSGYPKILQTMTQARNDGHDYVWIDTC